MITCLSLGMLSGLAVKFGNPAWYANLYKPWFTPPNWIFAPVWAVLYIMIGIVFGQLWRFRHHDRLPFVLFTVQFVFNLLWSSLFFYQHQLELALYDLTLLWGFLASFVILTRTHRVIFWLCLPYLAWVTFALTLNFYIYKMNVFPLADLLVAA